jgi:hypothetical protein
MKREQLLLQTMTNLQLAHTRRLLNHEVLRRTTILAAFEKSARTQALRNAAVGKAANAKAA